MFYKGQFIEIHMSHKLIKSGPLFCGQAKLSLSLAPNRQAGAACQSKIAL